MRIKIEVLILFTTILVQLLLILTPVHVEADPDTITVPDDHPTIQYAIGNATEGETIFVRSGTYEESLIIDKRLTIQGEDKATTFIDGLGSSKVVNINTGDVEFSGFTVYNGSKGIYLMSADGAVISDCVVCNCTEQGIYVDTSFSVSIENCTICGNDSNGIYLYYSNYVLIEYCECSNNAHGISIAYSDDISIAYCNSYNNSNDGINLLQSDNTLIMSCDVFNNSNDGISLTGSNVLSVCNSTFQNNHYGLGSSKSIKLYVSRSAFFNNSDDGLSLSGSSGVVANCNFTDNQDRGIHSSNSVFKARFCSFEDNNNYGIYSGDLSTFNATENWWGNETSPYHPSLNPTGIGNQVSDYVEFDP